MEKKEKAAEPIKEEAKKEEQVKVEFPKVLIFTAMQSERDKIVQPALTKLGLLGRTDIWSVITGVGKVNAAVSTSMALNAVFALNPQEFTNVLCINVGVCGGNDVAARDAKCVQIHRVCNNDFDTSAVDGEAFRKPVLEVATAEKTRTCFTQDHFCTDPNELPQDGEPYYVDMELFGIAAACSQFGVRLVSLKSVCDVIGSGKQKEQYEGVNFDSACGLTSELLVEYLSAGTDVVLK